jgi:hypothetical protein
MGAVADSVIMYPVTPTSSVAVKAVMGTVNELKVPGMLNAVTVGGVASASVTVVEALRLVETLSAPSLAQA